jgi:superfamily II DNA or RNA helicase
MSATRCAEDASAQRVLTQWTAHLSLLADELSQRGHDPVVLRGGMGPKARAAALARLQPQPEGTPLLAIATGPYVGEGFDCPALAALFLAAPISFKGRLVQHAGRILRRYPTSPTRLVLEVPASAGSSSSARVTTAAWP